MAKIESHEDLDVWQLSMVLVEQCYALTKSFWKEELFSLTSQIRRSAVSIPANIAEGIGRDQTGYFIQFLRIAMGSSRELDTHLQLAIGLKMTATTEATPCRNATIRVSKMLRSLIRSLEERD